MHSCQAVSSGSWKESPDKGCWQAVVKQKQILKEKQRAETRGTYMLAVCFGSKLARWHVEFGIKKVTAQKDGVSWWLKTWASMAGKSGFKQWLPYLLVLGCLSA